MSTFVKILSVMAVSLLGVELYGAFTINVPGDQPSIQAACDYLSNANYAYWTTGPGSGDYAEAVAGHHTILVAPDYEEYGDVSIRNDFYGFSLATLTGLTIQGQTSGPDQSTIFGQVRSYVAIGEITIDGLAIVSTTAGVVVSYASPGWTISNNDISSTGTLGIVNYYLPADVIDNTIVSASIGVYQPGIFDGNSVSGNQVSLANALPGQSWGIYLSNPDNDNGQILNNTVSGFQFGIRYDGYNGLISGNEVDDYYYQGIRIERSSGCVIANNYVHDVPGSGQAIYGYADRGDGTITVENNQIENVWSGIQIIGGEVVNIRNNIIDGTVNPGGNQYAGYAIIIYGGQTIYVENNTCIHIAAGITPGLPLVNSDVFVTDNIFSGWSDDVVPEASPGDIYGYGGARFGNIGNLQCHGNWFTGFQNVNVQLARPIAGDLTYNVIEGMAPPPAGQPQLIRLRGSEGAFQTVLNLDHNTFNDSFYGVLSLEAAVTDVIDMRNSLSYDHTYLPIHFSGGTVTLTNNFATNDGSLINFSSETRFEEDFLYLSCATPPGIMFGATDGTFLGALPAWCADECGAVGDAVFAALCGATHPASVQSLHEDIAAAAQTPLDGMCTNCQAQRDDCLQSLLDLVTP